MALPLVSGQTLERASASLTAVGLRAGNVSRRETNDYEPGWGLPSAADQADIVGLMTGEAPQGGSAPASPTAVG